MERTAIFVDGANLYRSTVNLGWQVDFNKVLREFGKDLYRAYYFTALPSRQVKANIHTLVDFLKTNGWSVVSKLMKERRQEDSDIIRVKGNMDVELTVHAMREIENYDRAVFFTGDGDFLYLVQDLMNAGVKVTVVSSFNCDQPICSVELRNQADTFIDLADPMWRDRLEKLPGRQPLQAQPMQPIVAATAISVAVKRRSFIMKRK